MVVPGNKFVSSNCEKYIVLWAGKICWATRFKFAGLFAIHPT